MRWLVHCPETTGLMPTGDAAFGRAPIQFTKLMQSTTQPNNTAALRTVKIIHTVIWAWFAGCVIAIPIVAALGYPRVAAILVAVVFIEVLILMVNRMSCPLTAVAARYTSDREPNFDIYLPRWLAKHNKTIFGALYAAGIAYTAYQWLKT